MRTLASLFLQTLLCFSASEVFVLTTYLAFE